MNKLILKHILTILLVICLLFSIFYYFQNNSFQEKMQEDLIYSTLEKTNSCLDDLAKEMYHYGLECVVREDKGMGRPRPYKEYTEMINKLDSLTKQINNDLELIEDPLLIKNKEGKLPKILPQYYQETFQSERQKSNFNHYILNHKDKLLTKIKQMNNLLDLTITTSRMIFIASECGIRQQIHLLTKTPQITTNDNIELEVVYSRYLHSKQRFYFNDNILLSPNHDITIPDLRAGKQKIQIFAKEYNRKTKKDSTYLFLEKEINVLKK